MSSEIKDRGRIVTTAATGINLALGVLYTWSIFKGAIRESIELGGAGAFNWNLAALNDPYAVCCLVFAFAMILAGKCQDKYGPRITAFMGGLMVGAGFIWISQTTSYVSWILGFGVLVGMGIAFGYASATPPALKWHPPMKTGKIAGIVVSGFGLASLYIAPLSNYTLKIWGLQKSMLFFGIGFMVVVGLLSMFLVNPPEGYAPKGFVERRARSPENQKTRAKYVMPNSTPLQMIKTPSFWGLWLLYFIGAGAGLMVIGSLAGMAKKSLGENAFLAVAILAVGNAAGRLCAGVLSDKIGRKRTLVAVFSFQAALMYAAVPIISSDSANPALLVGLATFIGFNYGANLALFPAFAKDLWGIKNFGVNYGVIFTAWGVGGFVLSRASQALAAKTGAFTASLQAAGLLLIVGAGLAMLMKTQPVLQEDLKEDKAGQLIDNPLGLKVRKNT